jgi:hypothetical protein
MADNVTADPGTGGAVFATDDVAGVHYPITKLAHGALDAVTLVSTASGLPVQQQGTFAVNLNAGTNNIGDVDVLTVPAPLNVTGGGAELGALRVTLANDSTGVVSVDDNGGSLTVDGTVTVTATDLDIRNLAPATDVVAIGDGVATATVRNLASNDALNVAIVDGSGAQITSFGGGTEYTEDAASAADPAGSMLIARRRDALATETTLDGDNTALNATAKGELYVKHVDAIPASQSGAWNITNVSGTVSLPTGASTLTEQQTQTTALQLLDDVVATDGAAALTKCYQVGGTDGTNAQILSTNASGHVNIADGGNSITVDGTVTGNQGTPNTTANRWPVQITDGTDLALVSAGGALLVDGSATTQPVSGTVTANAGTGSFTVAQATASSLNAQVVGTVAHDGIDSGNPVKIGLKALTNLETVTLVASGDRTDGIADLDGAQMVRIGAPHADLLSQRVTDTGGTSTAFTTFGAGGASIRNYITAISIFNSSATDGYVDFRDGAAGSVLFTVPAPKGGGAVISNAIPLFKTTANTALAYDVSGALTTVYISVSGYQAK